MAQNSGSQSVVWFLAGAAIGATVALLFAPQSGEETRRLIAEKASEGKDKLSEASREVAGKGRELYDKGRRIADEAADLFDRGKRLVQG